MDFFEQLIERILKDVIKAQNSANMLSARLAEIYENPPPDVPQNIVYFPVPNSVVKEFEFSLKFGIDEIAAYMRPEAAQALDEMVNEVMSSIQTFITRQGNAGQISRLRKSLKAEFLKLYQAQNHDFEAYFQSVLNFIKTILDERPEMQGVGEKEQVLNDLGKNLKPYAESFFHNAGPPDTLLDKELKIIYDMNVLTEVGEEAVCDIRVKVEMRNFRWAFMDDKLGGTQKKLL